MSKEIVKDLQEVIEKYDSLVAVIKEKQNEFNTMMLINFSSKKELELQIEALKDNIKVMAIGHFNETKNKDYIGGIKIQETNSISYDDKVAFNWCLDKKLFLELDKKSFEKAVDSLNVDFVTKTKDVRVTFPKIIKLED
jgi:hypothetical protein